jgi:predicted amidohydrolase
MRKIGLAEASYIERADTVRFRNVVATIRAVDDSLFALSQQAVDRGAGIVCWSENNGIAWKADEEAFIKRGQRFAARNKVYLLMTICVVNPGKITPGKKFLENEAILAGPEGNILTRFHKNNPVPMVEASQPGDGIIPVVKTAYGRLAVSICYDADFPLQMRQVGDKGADLLLLPSGDWYAISPFHTYMAVYRGIENGCSVFREVSNGLSLATDYRGKGDRQSRLVQGWKVLMADGHAGGSCPYNLSPGSAMSCHMHVYFMYYSAVVVLLPSGAGGGPFFWRQIERHYNLKADIPAHIEDTRLDTRAGRRGCQNTSGGSCSTDS